MKTIKIILTFVIILWTGVIFGQINTSTEKCHSKYDSLLNRIVYTSVDSMPQFPGGEKAMDDFLNKNFHWKDDGNDFSGSVIISIIVEPDGSLTNKRVERAIHVDADNKILNIIDKMPKWKPGKCNGKNVAVKYFIRFKYLFR